MIEVYRLKKILNPISEVLKKYFDIVLEIFMYRNYVTCSYADWLMFPRKWITVYKVFYWIITLLYSVVETSH